MEQKLFSKFIYDFLQVSYPEFLATVKYCEDGSFNCDARSPSGKFAMWIATYNEEISYGFESPDGKTDIHSHISCYVLEDLSESLETLSNWIKSVHENRTVIYFNDSQVWDWIDYSKLLQKENKKLMRYQKHFWKDS